MSMAVDKEYTEDTLFDGRIRCLQHRRGYRFSVDAVLLGNFIQPRPGDRILDLGCGCAIIPLILAYRWPKVSITGLEIQPALAALANKNVGLNNWQERIEIVPGDLKEVGKYTLNQVHLTGLSVTRLTGSPGPAGSIRAPSRHWPGMNTWLTLQASPKQLIGLSKNVAGLALSIQPPGGLQLFPN